MLVITISQEAITKAQALLEDNKWIQVSEKKKMGELRPPGIKY